MIGQTVDRNAGTPIATDGVSDGLHTVGIVQQVVIINIPFAAMLIFNVYARLIGSVTVSPPLKCLEGGQARFRAQAYFRAHTPRLQQYALKLALDCTLFDIRVCGHKK